MIPIAISMKETLMLIAVWACFQLVNIIDTEEAFIREKTVLFVCFVCLFDLILYVSSTIFQLDRDGFSWVEPVLS